MEIYLATYNWHGSDQWATYGLFQGELNAVYNREIDAPSDLDFVDLKPISGERLKDLQSMGYAVQEVE